MLNIFCKTIQCISVQHIIRNLRNLHTVSITLNCPLAPHRVNVAPDWSNSGGHWSATRSPTAYVCTAGTKT